MMELHKIPKRGQRSLRATLQTHLGVNHGANKIGSCGKMCVYFISLGDWYMGTKFDRRILHWKNDQWL